MFDLDLDELIEKLQKADDSYFNSVGTETLTDSEYDRLKQYAFKLNPAHPYFSRIGSDVRGGKTRLPYTMGSLDQIYHGEYPSWASKYAPGKKKVVISRKKDGISGMVEYRGAVRQIGYSRGNGVEGADLTRHLDYIQNLPKNLPDTEDYLVVRGEFIMSNTKFNANWAGKFANPRVTVSGTMNRAESRKDILADIDFIAYEIVATNGTPVGSKEAQLELLKSLGFQVVNYESFEADTLNDAVLEALLVEARANSDYELDGIVLTVDEIEQLVSQRNSVSLNPEHSAKFKVNSASDEVTAVVSNIIWEISKNGLFKPRVEIIPVKLFGTTVTFATGHNAKNIVDNGIGIGATIKITKAGSVIPYIVSTVTQAPKHALPPQTAGSEWEWNSNGVEIVLKDIDSHPVVRLKQLLDFVETLNVDLLKESSLSKMFTAYKLEQYSFDDAVVLLTDLMEHEWINVIGSNGSKIYSSLHRRLQKLDLATFLGAVKYFGAGFGVRKAKKVLGQIGSDDAVWSLKASDIESMDGFDTTANQVVAGLAPSKALLDRLIKSGVAQLVKEQKTDELKDLNVVMTGFRDPDLAATIEKRGGKNGSSVSKKTTHLLTYDANSNSGKAKKARDLGVKVMTPDEFKDEFNL